MVCIFKICCVYKLTVRLKKNSTLNNLLRYFYFTLINIIITLYLPSLAILKITSPRKGLAIFYITLYIIISRKSLVIFYITLYITISRKRFVICYITLYITISRKSLVIFDITLYIPSPGKVW